MGNETVDNLQQRGFTTSARADDADELIFTDGKIHVRESPDLCGVVFDGLLKTFRDPLDLNHGVRLKALVQNVPIVPVVQSGLKV